MAGKPYPQVVLLGDSLFQNSVAIQDGFSFQASLQARYIRRMDIVNRGFSGYNTDNVLKYLTGLFAPPSDTVPKIDYLLVLLGANDAVREYPRYDQHVPKDRYRENLTKIINHPDIKAHNPKILLVTPPPVDEIRMKEVDLEKGWPEVTRFQALSAEYSQIVRDIAAETPGAVTIDLWKALMDYAVAKTPDFNTSGPSLGTFDCGQRGKLADLLPDGLHMSGEAYKIFFDTVVPHIAPEWANLSDEDRTGFLLPDWRAIEKTQA